MEKAAVHRGFTSRQKLIDCFDDEKSRQRHLARPVSESQPTAREVADTEPDEVKE